MSMLTISCPSCGFSRQMPAERVPDGERQVTCPQCQSVFGFSKSAADRRPAVASEPLPPQPPRQTPPQQPYSQEPLRPQQPQQPLAPPPTPTPTPTPTQPPPQSQPQQPKSPQSQPAQPVGRGAAPRMAQRRPPPHRELTDIGALFKESWEIFQRRFATLIGLFLLCMAAFSIPAGTAVGLGLLAGMAIGEVAILVMGAVGMVASIYLGFRCLAAFLLAVADERLCLKDALTDAQGLVAPLLWVGFLTSFVIIGGFMLFGIPGIIFTVWFCFSQFVVVREDLRGMDALLKSREYVRGQWFNVALRLLLVWAASLLVGAIPMAGPILGIVFLPYVMIFQYLIYRDLREMKGELPFPCSISDKMKWPGVALVGFVAAPVLLISVIGLSVLGPLAQFVSREGVTLQSSAPSGTPRSDDQGLRVINFPPKEAPLATTTAAEPATPTPPLVPTYQSSSPTEPQASSPAGDEHPENIHVFIYAVNYTGTIKANGNILREMEGKPDMQYNYNLDGRKLRYGQNLIEVEYAELPSHHDSLLRVRIQVTRSRPGMGSETLHEWSMEDKGRGRSSFPLDIPR